MQILKPLHVVVLFDSAFHSELRQNRHHLPEGNPRQFRRPAEQRPLPSCISRPPGEFFRESPGPEPLWTNRCPLPWRFHAGNRSFRDPCERSSSCSSLCLQSPSRVLQNRILVAAVLYPASPASPAPRRRRQTTLTMTLTLTRHDIIGPCSQTPRIAYGRDASSAFNAAADHRRDARTSASPAFIFRQCTSLVPLPSVNASPFDPRHQYGPQTPLRLLRHPCKRKVANVALKRGALLLNECKSRSDAARWSKVFCFRAPCPFVKNVRASTSEFSK